MDIGIEFSQYRVIEHIGRGGMADVWSAQDRRLGRTVAIKTIARDLSAELDPVKLFEREAKTIAGLEHPHILPIYEFGEYEGQLFIVMRYVSGGSLENMLDRGALSPAETLRIARAVGQALEYAHDNNVIHLDLKPSNLLLDSYQSPYLADFGLAAVLGPEGRATNPGSGTLLYMAPEQLTSEQLDLRADIYSFGILVFHMITGELPFDGAQPLAIKQLQLRENLPDATSVRSGLPPALNKVLRTSTAFEPSRRYARIEEMVAALEQALMGGNARTAWVVPDIASSNVAADAVQDGATLPIEQMLLGGLVSKLGAPSLETNKLDISEIDAALTEAARNATLSNNDDGATRDLGDLDVLVSRPIDQLLSRTDEMKPIDPAATEIFTQDLGALLRAPVDALIRRTNPQPAIVPPISQETTRLSVLLDAPLDDLISHPMPVVQALSPEEAAQREVEDIYNRARRAWARGQGKFVLGVTDLLLISDYYSSSDTTETDLDDAGRQMFLRGAIEYDHEVELWWGRVAEEDRRWAALHAVRSENAPARVRALRLLTNVADSKPPQIPKLVAQALATERDHDAQMAALHLLEKRARPA